MVNEDNSNRKGNVINKNRRAARAAHIVLTNKKRAARAARIFLILLLVLENSKRENTLFVCDFIENVSIPQINVYFRSSPRQLSDHRNKIENSQNAQDCTDVYFQEVFNL